RRNHASAPGPGPARHLEGSAGRVDAGARGRGSHCREQLADLRRGCRRALDVRRACAGGRAASASPDRRSDGGRLRSALPARRTGPRDRGGAPQGANVARRHRPRRDQRGLRLGGPLLVTGARAGHGAGQRQRRGDRPRPSRGRERKPFDRHRVARARAQRSTHRAGHHVLWRCPGHGHGAGETRLSMATEAIDGAETLVTRHVLEYPYKRSVGLLIGRFLAALRDRRFLGVRMSDGRVLVPPAEYDPFTAESLTDLVDVGSAGVVTTWTWITAPRPQQPLQHPFAWALIRLDGADSALLHV